MRFVRGWEPRPHQVRWIAALQALADRLLRSPAGDGCTHCVGVLGCKPAHRTNKLLIEAFPASGKTNLVLQWLEWLIGKETLRGAVPQIGLLCYSDDPAQLRSIAIRDTIEHNELYKFVFATALPAKEKGWGQKEWFLRRADPGQKDPTLRASGLGGTIQSYRFPTATVIDDPDDPKLVKVPGQRDETWRIYRNSILTRGTQGMTPLVVTATRWAEDDLPGRLRQVEGDWHIERAAALGENEQSVWPLEMVNGIPCGISTATLLETREKDYTSFLTQYQALPPAAQGGLFEYFAEGPTPAAQEITKIIQFWDTATTARSWSSYHAMTEFWKLHNGRVFLNRVINVKENPAKIVDLMQQVANEAEKVCPNTILAIEDAQAGPVYGDFLQYKSGLRVKRHAITGGPLRNNKRGPRDPESRALAVAKYFETGTVYLPRTWVPWKDAYLSQMRSFPFSQNTDMVMATVGALEMLFPMFAGPPVAPFRLVPHDFTRKAVA